MATNGMDGHRANILIVDDRPDKLLVFKTILDDLEQQVVLMRSGEDALRWLLENDCAVILLDVNMPGMDGFETAQLIRSRSRSADIPIIFITAFVEEVQTMRGYALGAVDYILSPVMPVVLRSKVAVFVRLFKLAQQIQSKADERVSLAREQAARAAAEQSMQEASFLAAASKILGSSLDVNSLMVSATQLAVPMLGDASVIVVTNGSGISPRIVCAPEGDGGGANALAHNSAWLGAVNDVLATGRQKFVDDFAAFSQPATLCDGRSLLPEENQQRYGIEQVVLLPLLGRGKVRGVLTLAVGPARKRFDRRQIALATDIAGHVAMALENCLLFKEIQDASQRTSEFLATLSHELRNPLAPMRNAVYAMRLGGVWPAEASNFKEIIERQLEHMTHLVDDLLDAARISRGKIQLRTEQVDLVEKISRVLEGCRPLIEKAGHQLNVSVPREPVWVKADRVRLQQIFENILVNAIKYTDSGGRIEISLKVENDEAIVVIRDNGVGIAVDLIPRVWEMFVQVDVSSDRTRNGLGIGLTLARNLVQLHGGTIDCVSEGLGKGSEFTVRLPIMVPVSTNDPAGDLSGAQKADESPMVGRIMVVDDNQDSAQSLGVLIGKWGHKVALAYDGPSALELARTFRPDLVFLDIGMPKMNGYEVARRLREDAELANTRLIVLSGYGATVDHIRSKEAGFDHHLVKPVDPKGLPRIIASVLTVRHQVPASDGSEES
jgi:signal transduction histidine kinase/DNA-binding response OmpR family regulator